MWAVLCKQKHTLLLRPLHLIHFLDQTPEWRGPPVVSIKRQLPRSQQPSDDTWTSITRCRLCGMRFHRLFCHQTCCCCCCWMDVLLQCRLSEVEKDHRGSIIFSSGAPMEITLSNNIIFIDRPNGMPIGRPSNKHFWWSDVKDPKSLISKSFSFRAKFRMFSSCKCGNLIRHHRVGFSFCMTRNWKVRVRTTRIPRFSQRSVVVLSSYPVLATCATSAKSSCWDPKIWPTGVDLNRVQGPFAPNNVS